MAIKLTDRKLLWAHSGARCAICRAPLTEPPTGDDPAAVIGEECHIVARSRTGPRGDEPPPVDGIDSYANLILLCPNDHRLIDSQPKTYRSTDLRQTKATHEAWVCAQLAQAISTGLPASGGADPLLPIAASVVSEAIWDVLHDPAYRLLLVRGLPPGTAHSLAVKTTTAPLFRALQRVRTEHHVALATFLDSNEVRQLIAQVYKGRLTRARDARGLARDFELFWRSWHGRMAIGVDVSAIAQALVQGWDAALPAVTGDVITDTQVRNIAHQLTTERLAGLESAIDLIAEDGGDVALRADALQETLRRYAALRYGDIDVSAMGRAARAPLRDLYVPPRFRVDDALLSYGELLQETFRLVVLGDPGAGKTTFATKVCLDMATGDHSLSGGLRPVGLIVRLHRAARRIAAGELSPLDALHTGIVDVIRHEFQAERDADAIEYLLRAGRIVVVFDGLDELPTARDRLAIRDALEHFAMRYPQAPIIVTARAVGYGQAPLDPMHFRLARIIELDRSSVAEYARRWFSHAIDDLGRAARVTEGFMDATEGIADVRSSPMLMTLLCAVYERQGTISTSRAAIYQQLAELLYSRWDVQRGLAWHPPSAGIRAAIARLAWVMLRHPSTATGITAAEAISEITAYLTSRRNAEADESREMAQQLIDHLRGRAWVITEIGVDQHGDGLYAFTHHTFLEYFAAEYIANDSPTLADIAGKTLRMLMERREVVAQLVAHLLDGRSRDGARELLSAMVDMASTTDEREATDSFADWVVGTLEVRPA